MRAAPRSGSRARRRRTSAPTASTSSTRAARRRGRPSSTSTSTSSRATRTTRCSCRGSPAPGDTDEIKAAAEELQAMSRARALDARAGRPARRPDDRQAAAQPLRRGGLRRRSIAAIDAGPARPTPRGLLLRAEGRAWTGGVDVNMFHGLSPDGGAERVAPRLRARPGDRGPAVPDGLRRARAGLTWGFELALACDLIVAGRGRAVRPRRDRRRADAVDGRPAAPGREGRPEPREGARLHRRALRRRDAARLGRRQHRSGPTTSSTSEARKLARRARQRPDASRTPRRSGSSPSRRSAARAPADAIVPELSGALFETEDLKNAVESFLREGPGKATYEGR